MLQCDDSAFHFFVLSTTTCCLVPAWISLASRAHKTFAGNQKLVAAAARTSAENSKIARIKKDAGKFTSGSSAFLANLVVTSVLTIVFLWTLRLVLSRDGDDADAFDPFSTLGIDPRASAGDIKKACRKLVLQWHPDHCVHGPLCVPKFHMIMKAHQALTDPEARKNWEENGNPDGAQTMELSLGLPSTLVNPECRNLVLLVHLIFVVALTPCFVWLCCSNSATYGDNNVMCATYSLCNDSLAECTMARNMPEMLAASGEFRSMSAAASQEENESIKTFLRQFQSTMAKPKWCHPSIVRRNTLLQSHLLRKTNLFSKHGVGKELDDLDCVLSMSSKLADAMVSVCKHKDSFQTAAQCVNFGQHLTQAVSFKGSPLLQLPHFTPEHAQQCRDHNIATVPEFRHVALDKGLKGEKAKATMAGFTNVQKKDVHKCLSSICPQFLLETRVFVDDEDDDRIHDGDIATLEVSATRTNSVHDGNQETAFVHAPHFPFLKTEAIWMLFGSMNGGKVISAEKVESHDEKVVHKIQFLAPSDGAYEFDLLVKSDSYIGADVYQKVAVATLDKTGLPEYKAHQDDADLDKEPTLFEQMLNDQIEEDSDDESDDDEEETFVEPALAMRKARLQQIRQSEDDNGNI